MKDIIVCDLDGTLADIRHRRHLVETTCTACDGHGVLGTFGNVPCMACMNTGKVGKPDWRAFFAACVDDKPLQTTMDAVHALNEKYFVWIVSGRSDEVRKETVDWLIKHNLGIWDRLIMRTAGDYTPDDELKRRWLHDGTIPKDRVFCVFEDRDRVVKMWRDEGLTCYQVADGDF